MPQARVSVPPRWSAGPRHKTPISRLPLLPEAINFIFPENSLSRIPTAFQTAGVSALAPSHVCSPTTPSAKPTENYAQRSRSWETEVNKQIHSSRQHID